MHKFSIQNLSKGLVANREWDKACEILDKRATTIYQRLEALAKRNGSTGRIAELEDELCDILLQLVGIDIDRNNLTGACITAVLSQANYLNEKMRAHGIGCYICRKCDILERYCFIAWDNEDLQMALKYAEEKLSFMQEHGEHSELTLSNCLYHCGVLKAATGNRIQGIDMIQNAVNIDTRRYGEMYPVTYSS